MADESLDLIAELAGKARDEAARSLAASRKTEQQIIKQLQALDDYHCEYRQNLQQELAGAGMTPSSLTNYRGFLSSLEAAVERAQKSLERQRQQVAQQQLEWLTHWRKANAIETLIERRAREARYRDGRVEQRHSDELASQIRQRIAGFQTALNPRP